MAIWDYIRHREGGTKEGDYTAFNEHSKAYGAYQIIPSTWKDIRNRSGLELPENIREATNEQQDQAANWLQKDFARMAKVSEDDYAGHAMTWNYGAGGYNDIMSADPNAAIESVIGYEASKLNSVNGKRVAGMTVGQFRDEFQKEAESFKTRWGAGVVPSDPARSKSLGELANEGKTEEQEEEEMGILDKAKNALGILSDAHVAKHQPTPQTSAPPPIMQGGGMPVTPSMPMEARTDVPLRNGLYGPPEEPTDYLNPNLNKYSTAAARTAPEGPPDTRTLTHMGLPTGDVIPQVGLEVPSLGQEPTAPLLSTPQAPEAPQEPNSPQAGPLSGPAGMPESLIGQAMKEEAEGVPVEEDPHDLSDKVTRSAAETELTVAGASEEEKKQVLEGDPKNLWQRLKKWQSGLSDHRKQQLLAIGAGLLSGRNWSEGFAGASQNLLGVEQQRQEMEHQLMMQDRRDAAAIERASAYRGYQRVGSVLDPTTGETIGGVSYDPNTAEYFTTNPDGTRRVIHGAEPLNNSDATGTRLISPSQVAKIRTSVQEGHSALKALDRMDEYLVNYDTGIEGFIRDTGTMVKTFMNSTDLSEEQISAALAQGEIQGLIGKVREDVIGPGVMTEQDAMRVLMFIGGGLGNVRGGNPAVIKERLNKLREGIMRRYSQDYDQYIRYTEVPNSPFLPMEPYVPPLDQSNGEPDEIEEILTQYD